MLDQNGITKRVPFSAFLLLSPPGLPSRTPRFLTHPKPVGGPDNSHCFLQGILVVFVQSQRFTTSLAKMEVSLILNALMSLDLSLIDEYTPYPLHAQHSCLRVLGCACAINNASRISPHLVSLRCLPSCACSVALQVTKYRYALVDRMVVGLQSSSRGQQYYLARWRRSSCACLVRHRSVFVQSFAPNPRLSRTFRAFLVTKFFLASHVALPAACACICRHLYILSSNRDPTQLPRRTLFECSLCVALPLFYMVFRGYSAYFFAFVTLTFALRFLCSKPTIRSGREFRLRPVHLSFSARSHTGLATIHHPLYYNSSLRDYRVL